MDIFAYEALKEKAHREIDRLRVSQRNLDSVSAIDHALNAAFTIYHLIQWRHEHFSPGQKIKVHDFISSTKNKGLKILHNIVTANKHVTVTVKFYQEDTTPQIVDNIIFICAGDGSILTTGDGKKICSGDSKIDIFFGKKLAVNVLNEALKEFL
ncbi:hypothetical protein [Legionella donaldsonii]|uniref:hypothetical protein n=1 Tax=Legionella donaldsonii TaxID=45060 RepID=UPI00399D3F98